MRQGAHDSSKEPSVERRSSLPAWPKTGESASSNLPVFLGNEQKNTCDKRRKDERAYAEGDRIGLRSLIDAPRNHAHGNQPGKRNNQPAHRDERNNIEDERNQAQRLILIAYVVGPRHRPCRLCVTIRLLRLIWLLILVGSLWGLIRRRLGLKAAEPDTAPAAAPEAGPAVADIAGFAAPRSFEPGLPEAGPAFEAAAVPA